MTDRITIRKLKLCSNLPNYFIRNYIEIQTPDEGLSKFNLHLPQEELLEIIHNNRFSICNKPRQTGITSICVGYLVWYSVFQPQRVSAVLHDNKVIRDNVSRIYVDMIKQLPEWFGAKIVSNTKNQIRLENGSIIIFDDLNCEKLRGKGINLLLIDDIGWCDNDALGKFLHNILPMIEAGVSSKVVINSTPRELELEEGKTDHYKKLWYHALWGMNDFVPYTFSSNKMVGRDAKWLHTIHKQLGTGKFKQEVLCEFDNDERKD